MTPADRYREWLRNFPQEPPDRLAMAQAAIDAYECCAQRADFSVQDLQPLVLAASSPHLRVFDTGCSLLVLLASQHVAAQQSLLAMANGKNATARFHAVAYLSANLPLTLRVEIVALALDDRSSKVRTKGVEAAEQFRLTQFLAKLEDMQRTETNEGVQESLAFHIPLLRDGFWLRRSPDGAGYVLSVRGPGGVAGRLIANGDYSDEFVRAEIARLKEGFPWER